MSETDSATTKRQVWYAGRTVGAKRALKPKQIWEIRFYLNQHRRLRDRALFDLAIDSLVTLISDHRLQSPCRRKVSVRLSAPNDHRHIAANGPG